MKVGVSDTGYVVCIIYAKRLDSCRTKSPDYRFLIDLYIISSLE